MKKIIYSLAVMALGFFAASCQQENLEPVAGSNIVTYTVQVPGAGATKALGDDISDVNLLVYEVYRTDVANDVTFTDADNLLYHKTAEVKGGVADIELELVNNQNFTVLFWAHNSANTVYDVADLTDVKVAQAAKANLTNTQAFSGFDFIEKGETLEGRTITLTRPVSQINIVTTPASLTAFNDPVVLKGSSVTVKGLSTSFNVATQAAGEIATSVYDYSMAVVPTDPFDVDGTAYKYVAMNYVGFAPAIGATVEVKYVIDTSEGQIENTITAVPVKPNYRTNIIGNLITSTSDYKVTLDAVWTGVADEIEIWDGKTLNAPSMNDAGEYIIDKPSEWAYLANQQNPMTKTTPAPIVINLTSDLDFGGNVLTGLVAPYNGSLTVNGNHKSLLNARVVSGTNDNSTNSSSLFISYTGSTLNVSNLNIKNVNVVTDGPNGYAGVVGSYIEGTANFENVNVYESKVHSVQSIGAMVGFIPAYGTVTAKNCGIDHALLTNADVEGESGAMGGFVGRVAGKLTVENVKIANTTIEAYVGTDENQKRSISKFIGNFVNGAVINVTGAVLDNVKIVAKNELAETQSCLYTEYLGGWRDEYDKNQGSVSINGIQITEESTNEDITINTSDELATAISEAADGAVIPVSGEITTTALNAGEGKSITIVGMSEDAAIDSEAARLHTKGNINFKNITIALPTNGDYINVGHDAQGGTMVFDNCKFVGSAAVMNGTITYNNCDFYNPNKYAAWVYSGNVTYNNCTFTGPDRAAKVYAEAGNAPVVVYNNCTFVATEKANKAAVEIDCQTRVSGTPYYVEINNPTIKNMGQAECYGNQYFNLQTLPDNATTGNGLGIVRLDGVGYSTAYTATQLQYLTNAGRDVTIELASDITGDFTYEQNNGENVVIDGAGRTMTGTITVTARIDQSAANTFVIKNLNFSTTDNARNFIYSSENNRYPHITVSNCSFEGPSAESDVVPVKIKTATNFLMEKCTAKNVHSLLQNDRGGLNYTIRDCIAKNVGRGISLNSVSGALVENVEIEARDDKYGIRIDAEIKNATTTIKNCNINAFCPVVVRSASVQYNLVFDGTNKMTAANTDGLWCAIGTSEYEKNGEKPTAATGKVTVTLNDYSLDAAGIYGASNL